MLIRTSALTIGLIATTLGFARRPDRRVVDTVLVGDRQSETTHGFAGEGVVAGSVNGLSYRQTEGWMHFALKTFEDTDVTVSLTFVRTDSVSRSYDVVVEDSVLATRELEAGTGTPRPVEVAVPFAITKGKSNIAIVIRARGGSTPALRELRTIQDHYEEVQMQNLTGVAR